MHADVDKNYIMDNKDNLFWQFYNKLQWIAVMFGSSIYVLYPYLSNHNCHILWYIFFLIIIHI